MGYFHPYEKDNTLCISVLQNHSPIPSSEEDMTCSHASPKYKASTSTTHFLPTLAVRSLPDVTHQELKVHQRPIFILTLYVRKTEECHRGDWKAGWRFPDVIDQELKVRERPIFILM